MHIQTIARTLLSLFCLLQGLATVVLDLNRTHAAHPKWMGHARFHVVWQTGTVALLSMVEVWLLWSGASFGPERFYLVALLACVPMAGFLGALVSRRMYGGTLSDPGGIPPVRVKISGRELVVDMNLVAEVAGVITVAVLVALFRYGSAF